MAERALPKESPIMRAWEAYKASPDYGNSFRWAEDRVHRDGSMWASFYEGWRLATERLEAEVAGLTAAREAAEARVRELIQAAAPMANALFNLSQGNDIDLPTRRSMKEAQERWDAARALSQKGASDE